LFNFNPLDKTFFMNKIDTTGHWSDYKVITSEEEVERLTKTKSIYKDTKGNELTFDQVIDLEPLQIIYKTNYIEYIFEVV
jgi:hypothetical protein